MYCYLTVLSVLFLTLSCGERSATKKISSSEAMNQGAYLMPLAVPCPASIHTLLKGPSAPNHCDIWGDKITAHFELGDGVYTLLSLSGAKDVTYTISGTAATQIEVPDGTQILGQSQDVSRKILNILNLKELRIGNQVRMEQVVLSGIANVKIGDDCKLSHVQIDESKSYQFGSTANFVDVKINKISSLHIGSKAYFELTKLSHIDELSIGSQDQTITLDLTVISKATLPNTQYWREQVSSLKLANSSFSYKLLDKLPRE